LVKSRRRSHKKKKTDNTLAPPGSSAKRKVRQRLYSIDKTFRRAKNKSKPDPAPAHNTDPDSNTDSSNPLILEESISILGARGAAGPGGLKLTAPSTSYDSSGAPIQLHINEGAAAADSSQGSSSVQPAASTSFQAGAAANASTTEESPVLSDKLPKNKRRLERLRQLSRSSSWKLGRTIFKSTFR